MSVGNRTVFICAGTCTAATAAAVDRLQDWRRWAKAYRNEDFGRLYEVHLPRNRGSVSSAQAREAMTPPEDPIFKIGYPDIEPQKETFNRHGHSDDQNGR